MPNPDNNRLTFREWIGFHTDNSWDTDPMTTWQVIKVLLFIATTIILGVLHVHP